MSKKRRLSADANADAQGYGHKDGDGDGDRDGDGNGVGDGDTPSPSSVPLAPSSTSNLGASSTFTLDPSFTSMSSSLPGPSSSISTPSPSTTTTYEPIPSAPTTNVTTANSKLVAVEQGALAPSPAGSQGTGSTATPTMTPTPASLARFERSGPVASGRPTMVPGSGDGTAYGEECFLWTDLPMNKGGFRYSFCAPSPNVSPSPLFPFYRNTHPPWPCPPVHLSWTDRSPFLRLSPTALTASTDKGYRSARANVGVREGAWYYEAIIERGDGPLGRGRGTGPGSDGSNPHIRVGWGRREASLDAPVGLDAYSYGFKDVGGEKVHLSRPKPYGRPFKTGDVVGCLIELPSRQVVRKVREEEDPAEIKRMRIPLKWKGVDYFEMAEFPPAREMEALVDREGKGVQQVQAFVPSSNPEPSTLKKSKNSKKLKQPNNNSTSKPVQPPRPIIRELTKLPGSKITFYLNGESLGVAFTDLYDFTPLYPIPTNAIKRGAGELEASHDDGSLGYFPMVSCFGKGKVRCNFGPTFEYPPRISPMEDEEGAEGAGSLCSLPLGTRPMCERWEEFMIEEAKQDELDEIEFTAKYEKENAERAAAKELFSRRGGSVAPSSSGKKSSASKNKKKKAGAGASGAGSGTAARSKMEGTPSTPRFTESTPARSTAPPEDIKVEDEENEASPCTDGNGSGLFGQERGDGDGDESVVNFGDDPLKNRGDGVVGDVHENADGDGDVADGDGVDMKSETLNW